MPAFVSPATENPYVGPRTFEAAQRHLFFGREAEARDLLARVVSEQLLLFYAQSGAGKSSLINTRLIPALQESGFVVLPVGRVSGDLPPGVADVPNIFLFNLKLSLDEGDGDPNAFAGTSLSDFLARLASEDGRRWTYDAALPGAAAAQAGVGAGQQPFVLVIDQFEEIVTAHPGRWRERAAFFAELNQALLDDPNLWVVLTLREDYVAALDPYASLMFNRLRARYYMERMGVAAALEAVTQPAALGGRPFEAGVAEQLVDNLRQVRIPGQEQPLPGQYVEPVQLQVVCYQLWENIKGRPPGPITAENLREAGDVDRALVQFYEETIAAVLADPGAGGITERQMRAWFSEELITDANTRGLVHQGRTTTGTLPNAAVRKLQARFLVRTETRSGGAWVELVHDRFVTPILESNAAWFARHQSPITQAAQAWEAAGRPASMLLSEEPLATAQAQLAANPAAYGELERTFVNQSQLDAERERARRQGRMIALLIVAAVVIALGAITAVVFAFQANTSARRAEASEVVARLAADNERIARATANAERVVAISLRGTAEALAILANEQAYAAQRQAATVEAALTVQVALANSLSELLAQVAPQTTATLEPPLTPTASATPTPTRAGGSDIPEATPLFPTPTPTSAPVAATESATPDLTATAVFIDVVNNAQSVLSQTGVLFTPTPADLLLPLPPLQAFDATVLTPQTNNLPPSKNANPDLAFGVEAVVLPEMNSVVRDQPGSGNGAILGYLAGGDLVKIAGGPTWIEGETDTIVWWYVIAPGGLRGWTPANTSQFTLLAPLEPQPQSQSQ